MSPLFVAGNIVGYIGLVVLWLQAVLGNRHIFKYVTEDTVLMNRIHKQIGIYGTLLIFVHPILQVLSYSESFSWIFAFDMSSPSATYVTYGRISFILLVVVWATSAIIREKIKWHTWKWLHIMTYPIVFLSFVHMKYAGTFFSMYPLLRTVLFLMFTIFVMVVLLRIFAFFSVFKIKTKIVTKEYVGENILLLTLLPEKVVVPRMGQHVYIQTRRTGNEHPFTVMEYNRGTREITLGIRKLGKVWNELEEKSIGDSIFLDGPYGTFTKEAQNENPKVIISGGIGVTPFVDLVRRYGKGAIYINCNRDAKDIVRRELLSVTAHRYVDILDSGAQTDDVIIGRISPEIISRIVGDEVKNLSYFVCGSPMFIKVVREMLIKLEVPKNSIYYEELGF